MLGQCSDCESGIKTWGSARIVFPLRRCCQYTSTDSISSLLGAEELAGPKIKQYSRVIHAAGLPSRLAKLRDRCVLFPKFCSSDLALKGFM